MFGAVAAAEFVSVVESVHAAAELSIPDVAEIVAASLAR